MAESARGLEAIELVVKALRDDLRIRPFPPIKACQCLTCHQHTGCSVCNSEAGVPVPSDPGAQLTFSGYQWNPRCERVRLRTEERLVVTHRSNTL